MVWAIYNELKIFKGLLTFGKWEAVYMTYSKNILV